MIKEMQMVRSLAKEFKEVIEDYNEKLPKMILINNKIYKLRRLPETRNICNNCKYGDKKQVAICENTYYLIIDNKYINLCWYLDSIGIEEEENIDKKEKLELTIKGDIKKAKIILGKCNF